MPIETAETLIFALRTSGLFTHSEAMALAEDLAPFGDDRTAMIRFLVDRDRVPVYQLRKVVHGKAAELFVGRYVILDKLGEGGMGKVFKARDGRDGRLVALKVIRPRLLANPVVRGRYDREVQAALTLHHPNIAGAYEAGEASGKHYLALEFVDGIDLSRIVRTFGVLSTPEASEYIRQAALGLQFAHDRGFVHRDVKPSNIVVSGERHHPDATEPARVRLLDMGLVRSLDDVDDPLGGSDLTRAGTVVGTPDYMAPEQAKNSSAVDHRADLYNLGGTFYFLLTGQPPFPNGSPIEKILQHQLDPPAPLQAVRKDVPADLARIISRLMAKKPADRFDSAKDVAEALQAFTHFTGPVPQLPRLPEQVTGAEYTTDSIAPDEELKFLAPPLPPPPTKKLDVAPNLYDRTPRPRGDLEGVEPPARSAGARTAKRKKNRRRSRWFPLIGAIIWFVCACATAALVAWVALAG